LHLVGWTADTYRPQSQVIPPRESDQLEWWEYALWCAIAIGAVALAQAVVFSLLNR
jgi:hypothetical protein